MGLAGLGGGFELLGHLRDLGEGFVSLSHEIGYLYLDALLVISELRYRRLAKELVRILQHFVLIEQLSHARLQLRVFVDEQLEFGHRRDELLILLDEHVHLVEVDLGRVLESGQLLLYADAVLQALLDARVLLCELL